MKIYEKVNFNKRSGHFIDEIGNEKIFLIEV